VPYSYLGVPIMIDEQYHTRLSSMVDICTDAGEFKDSESNPLSLSAGGSSDYFQCLKPQGVISSSEMQMLKTSGVRLVH